MVDAIIANSTHVFVRQNLEPVHHQGEDEKEKEILNEKKSEHISSDLGKINEKNHVQDLHVENEKIIMHSLAIGSGWSPVQKISHQPNPKNVLNASKLENPPDIKNAQAAELADSEMDNSKWSPSRPVVNTQRD